MKEQCSKESQLLDSKSNFLMPMYRKLTSLTGPISNNSNLHPSDALLFDMRENDSVWKCELYATVIQDWSLFDSDKRFSRIKFFFSSATSRLSRLSRIVLSTLTTSVISFSKTSSLIWYSNGLGRLKLLKMVWDD